MTSPFRLEFWPVTNTDIIKSFPYLWSLSYHIQPTTDDYNSLIFAVVTKVEYNSPVQAMVSTYVFTSGTRTSFIECSQ
jgi:hypothetical protein